MSETMDVNKELYESCLCNKCTYLVKRSIIPYDYEEFEISEEELLDENGNIVPIVHDVCSVLNMDVTYAVVECNKFKSTSGGDLFFSRK